MRLVCLVANFILSCLKMVSSNVGAAKLQAVTDLVNKLSDDIEKISLLPKGIASIH